MGDVNPIDSGDGEEVQGDDTALLLEPPLSYEENFTASDSVAYRFTWPCR